MEVWKTKDGSEVAVIGATWELNAKVSYASLAPEFKKNWANAWRNYGSVVGKGGDSLAIKDPAEVLANLNLSRIDPWDLTREDFFPWFRGRKNVKYFLHMDLAKSKDAVGIALGHQEPTGVLVVDWMHRHQAYSGKNIQFNELRSRYIYALHTRGFPLTQITFDQWQSVDMQQQLTDRGFETDEVSADKTMAPYDTLIELLTGGRLDYYNHPQFIREMQQLRNNGVKYDHPKGGSKDVADAVACMCWSCINHQLENPKPKPGKIRVHRATANKTFNPKYEKSRW